MIKKVLLLIIFTLVIACKKESPIINNNSLYKNISDLIKDSKNSFKSDSLRNVYLIEAVNKIQELDNDSLKTRLLIKVAYSNLRLRNWDNYKTNSFDILNRCISLKDTVNLSRAQAYLGYYYQSNYTPDSAYYFYNKALKSYSLINNELEKGKMLLSMSTIQESVKDYTGSEINAIKAISSLINSKDYRSLYLAYNTLGAVQSKMKNYYLAIDSHNIAIKYLKKQDANNFLGAISFNNIGWIYNEMNEYQKAIIYFKKALKTKNLLVTNPETYAMVIDNLAYSKFKLGDETELPKLFYKALKIRDSLKIYDGIVESSLHLSGYFLSKNDSVKAFNFAQNAEKNAVKSNYNEGLLESYLQLSKLEPGEKGKTYLNKYIKLSDSLQQKEREIREKFTRIAYETGEIEKVNVVVTKKNGLLTILILVGGALFTMIFIYIRQRSKNKELIFNQKQEEANTEIYNLMISEKTKFQEGSLKERIRISEELHDGIVNKLFGTRLSISLMNSGIPEEEIEQWDGHIESLREIEEDIRTLSHELKVEVFNIDNTFEKMVEELVEKRSKLSNFEPNLDFNIVSDWENISNKIKIHCYRTLQETLHNIHKYAKATKVGIHFYEINGMLHFEVTDNGIGFNPNNKTNGIGLKNIESRIEKLNGEVKFISSQGNGTKITMTIPIVS
mgnify:CR=1 FL=1